MSLFTCHFMKVKNTRGKRSVLGQLSDMDLRLLKVFKSVVECGGMAAAELELNIGTSTISRHVKDLETRLMLVLCRRGRAGFALTADGQQVYQQTLRLLASVDEFRNGIDDIHHRLGGRLDIALFDKTITNPQARVSEAVALFAQAAPGVDLHLHVASINAIERGVLDGHFHIGVIPSHRTSRTLAYADLFGETMLLYCGARHPLFATPDTGLTWAKLRMHAFAGLGYHSPNMELSRHLDSVGRIPGLPTRTLRERLRGARPAARDLAAPLPLRMPLRQPAAEIAAPLAHNATVRGLPGDGPRHDGASHRQDR
jgi:DNA-binding transcriptional LysR family regulator